MVDILSSVLETFRGTLHARNTLRSYSIDAISIKIILNGELLEADGILKHGYVVSDILERGIIPQNYVKSGGKRAIIINEGAIDPTKYPLNELYHLVADRLMNESRAPFGAMILQFLLAFFAMAFFATIATIVGWTVIIMFAIVYMIFRIVVQGARYVR